MMVSQLIRERLYEICEEQPMPLLCTIVISRKTFEKLCNEIYQNIYSPSESCKMVVIYGYKTIIVNSDFDGFMIVRKLN